MAFLVASGLLLARRRRRQHTSTTQLELGKAGGDRAYLPPPPPPPPPASNIAFSAAQLRAMTSGFAQQLGEGAFGAVFGGALPDGRRVAVKRMTLGATATNKYEGEAGFRRELEVLHRYRHAHIVALFGYCIEGGQTFSLVLEFMPGGTLLDRLEPAHTDPPLTAQQRFDIAAHVARGLYYLHAEATPPVIHQDVKSDNVLLATEGGHIVAKVADFGTARVVPKKAMSRDMHHSTVMVVGTTPYMPCEYLQFGHVSEKTDAYAFGVVLLELLTGKPPANKVTRELLAYDMAPALQQPEQLMPPLLDAIAPGGWPQAAAVALARVAARCVEQLVQSRCTMREVVGEVVALSSGAHAISGNPRAGAAVVHACKHCGARLRFRQGVALACFACKREN